MSESKHTDNESIEAVIDRIVRKHEAFFRLISQSLSHEEKLELLHTAIPSSRALCGGPQR